MGESGLDVSDVVLYLLELRRYVLLLLEKHLADLEYFSFYTLKVLFDRFLARCDHGFDEGLGVSNHVLVLLQELLVMLGQLLEITRGH